MIVDDEPLFNPPNSETSAVTTAVEWPELHQLQALIQAEFYKVSLQHSFYLGLMACALCVFAVVLFLNARYYHDFTLWGVGMCLLVFGLIQFLELEFAHSRRGLIQKMLNVNKSSQE